jgi:hypothetical protein
LLSNLSREFGGSREIDLVTFLSLKDHVADVLPDQIPMFIEEGAELLDRPLGRARVRL